MDNGSAITKSDKQSNNLTSTAESLTNMGNSNEAIAKSTENRSHEKHAEIIKDTSSNSNKDDENCDPIDNRNCNDDTTTDNSNKDLEIVKNNINANTVHISKENAEVIKNYEGPEVAKLKSNEENIIEFEVDSKGEKVSDSIIARDEKDVMVKDDVDVVKSSDEQNTKDMIEFDLDATVEGDREYSNVIILGNVPSNKNTVKRKRNISKRELLSLGATQLNEETHEFDGYADNERVYRKYRLREAPKPDYRIQTSITPITVEAPKKIKKLPKQSRRPSEEIFSCKKCDKHFFSSVDLRSHFRQVHLQTFTCSLCLQEYKTNKELLSHKRIHDEEKQIHMCHECKQAFSDHCDYLLHELTHTKPHEKLTCPECGLSYNKKGYEPHIVTHFNNTRSPCPICKKEILRIRLTAHVNAHSKRLECVECGKIFNSKALLDSHMDIHTGVKRCQCLYCGKAFRTSQQRNVHTRIHTKERLYTCTICDRTFVQPTDLKTHLERHRRTGKKECNICKRKVWDMSIHMKIHTEEKRFQCSECGKKYLCVNGLRCHMIFKHSKERPFYCQFCGVGYANGNAKKRHEMSKIHKRNVFKASMKKKRSDK